MHMLLFLRTTDALPPSSRPSVGMTRPTTLTRMGNAKSFAMTDPVALTSTIRCKSAAFLPFWLTERTQKFHVGGSALRPLHFAPKISFVVYNETSILLFLLNNQHDLQEASSCRM